MIAFHRTASIAPGKTAEALAFAHDVAVYLKEAYKVELDVQLPIGGNPNRIAWSTRYKDLAALDAFSTKTMADRHYLEIVTKGAGCFIAGSLNDSIWRSV